MQHTYLPIIHIRITWRRLVQCKHISVSNTHSMYVDYTEVHEPSGQLAGEIREMPNYLHSVLPWFVCGLIRMVNPRLMWMYICVSCINESLYTNLWWLAGRDSSQMLRDATPQDTSVWVTYRTGVGGCGTVVWVLRWVEEIGTVVAVIANSILVCVETYTWLCVCVCVCVCVCEREREREEEDSYREIFINTHITDHKHMRTWGHICKHTL